MRVFFLFFLFLHSSLLFSFNIHGEDTLQAVVSYGSEYLFNESVIDLNMVRDKIQTEKDDIKRNQYILFYKLYNSNSYNIEYTIDSLFALNDIPYALINELSMLLHNVYEKEKSLSNLNTVIIAKTAESNLYPCNEIYHTWDTKHPFNYNLLYEDQVTLKLVANQSEYFHPVSLQTINKYGGKPSSNFGWRDGKMHNGVDIDLDQWDSIFCTFPGMVRMAREYAGYGKVVVVRHYNGLETLYAHMQRIKVKSGQKVEAGTFLGFGGSTGHSTGSHLHFEIRYKGIPINPKMVIDFTGQKLLSQTIHLQKQRYFYACKAEGIKYHLVERGDYVVKIANHYGITVNEICELNSISARTCLKIGQLILISKE